MCSVTSDIQTPVLTIIDNLNDISIQIYAKTIFTEALRFKKEKPLVAF